MRKNELKEIKYKIERKRKVMPWIDPKPGSILDTVNKNCYHFNRGLDAALRVLISWKEEGRLQ